MKVIKPILFFTSATLATALIPYSGLLIPLMLVISSAFLVATAVKWNYVYTIFSATFSAALIFLMSYSSASILTDVISSAIFPLLSLVSATGIIIALKSKASVKTVLLSGTIGYFLLIASIYAIYGGSFLSDIVNLMKEIMFSALDSVTMSIPSDSAEVAAQLRNMYELYFETLKIVAPSLILSFIFLISYFTVKLSGRMAKNPVVYENVPSFSEVRAPSFLILITALSYFLQSSGAGFIAGLMSNLFMVLSVYYTVCGFSLIDFFLKLRMKKLSARFCIVLIAIIVLTLLSTVLYFANPILIAMFGGMLDSLFNYRFRLRGSTK